MMAENSEKGARRAGFIEPSVEVVRLGAADIITASTGPEVEEPKAVATRWRLI